MIKKIFTGKDMRFSKYSKSAAMRKLMENPKISGILNEKKERGEFYDTLSKHAHRGVTKDEFRETLGELYENSRTLSHKEVKEIGRAMKDTLGKNRIEMPSEQIKENRSYSGRDKQKLAPKSPIESIKNADTKPGVQNVIPLKGSTEPANLMAAESNRKDKMNNIISFSRAKKHSEKASRLLDDILKKRLSL